MPTGPDRADPGSAAHGWAIVSAGSWAAPPEGAVPLAEDETHGNLLAWVRVPHGARYSPHDNPVERIWGALKAYLANSPTPTMAGRIRQVQAFFRQPGPAQLLVTAAPTAHAGSPTNTNRTIGRPLSPEGACCRPRGDVVDGRTPYGD